MVPDMKCGGWVVLFPMNPAIILPHGTSITGGAEAEVRRRRCGGGGAEAEARKSTSQEARSQNHRKHGARIIGSTEPES